MKDQSLDHLHPDLKILCEQWISMCNRHGIAVGISETYRSIEDQNKAYAQGRTTPGKIITHARGDRSPHNCTDPDGSPGSKAFDFFILDDNKKCDWDATDWRWKTAIEIGEKLGLTSGSSWRTFKDNPHFELPDWKETTSTITT